MAFRLIAFLILAVGLFAQSTGKLKTSVGPSRAGVFIDEKYVGPAGNFGMARTYTLPAGQHTVMLTEPRYKDLTRMITVTAGQTTTLKENLEKLPPAQGPFGSIRTMHPDKFAAVYINGKYFGHVDEFSNFAQRIKIPAGDYDVKIVPVNGGAEYTQKIKVVANQTTLVESK